MDHARGNPARDKALTKGHAAASKGAAKVARFRLAVSFAKAVLDRRRELGLSQAEVAERSGLSQAKIARIESAASFPTLPLLRRLAVGLNASLNIAMDADREQITFTAHPAA
ncbi:helix-turn-helix domain-containing protein [Streptomyces sp. NBC_00212]|uniref:helix-turn-helix domain-containing protein n=1 Tax=Streptomyces sp. NBC_00212 TaxID=2975684 RepID=UPI0032517EB0